jgi:hypothetical protein
MEATFKIGRSSPQLMRTLTAQLSSSVASAASSTKCNIRSMSKTQQQQNKVSSQLGEAAAIAPLLFHHRPRLEHAQRTAVCDVAGDVHHAEAYRT